MTTSLSGLWQPGLNLSQLFYGSGCVKEHLLSALPGPASKAYIITGTSIAKNTPLVREVEALLGEHFAGTIAYVRQHGPLEDVELAVETVLRDPTVDTLISIGGGSPIDTAKVISYRASEKPGGSFLTHITIPTTLSAAECTSGGGYTKPDGVKIGFRAAEMGVKSIFYDPEFAKYTPKELWLSTGMRALDHAVECMYHPTSAEVPWRALAIWAVGELFECLPKAKESHPADEDVLVRLMLAAYASSGLKGTNLKGGMGLSHSLGHALGSPYGIPHGVTSCLTLAKVVRMKVEADPENARQIARLCPAVSEPVSGDTLKDALGVSDAIASLVEKLGFGEESLTTRNVSRDDIPLIAKRALGGTESGSMFEAVEALVQTIF